MSVSFYISHSYPHTLLLSQVPSIEKTKNTHDLFFFLIFISYRVQDWLTILHASCSGGKETSARVSESCWGFFVVWEPAILTDQRKFSRTVGERERQEFMWIPIMPCKRTAVNVVKKLHVRINLCFAATLLSELWITRKDFITQHWIPRL